MDKINSINLHAFRNNEHYQFLIEVDQLIQGVTGGIQALDIVYPKFQAALVNEADAIKVEQGSLKSQDLGELDASRDKVWSAIRGRAKATLNSPIEAEMESARVIMDTIDGFGNVRKMSYAEESSALTNLLDALKSPQKKEHIETMGLESWVNALNDLNAQFQGLSMSRNAELAGRSDGNVKNIRTIIDPLYGEIVDKVNATIELNLASPEIDVFVRGMNELIKHYKNSLAVRDGRRGQDDLAVSPT